MKMQLNVVKFSFIKKSEQKPGLIIQPLYPLLINLPWCKSKQ